VNTILITGGAGFIGSNLGRKLVQKGYNVIVFDNLSRQIHGNNPEYTSYTFKNLAQGIKFIKGDVTSKNELETAILESKCDTIVHFAAETGTGQSMYEIEKYTNVNTVGTAILLDILTNNKHQVNKVLVASSRALYGEGKYHSGKYGAVYPGSRSEMELSKGIFEVNYSDDFNLELVATDENSKIHPSSVYGITKQVQEQLVMTVCPSIGIAPVSLRYQNVYGPGQSLSNPYTGILSIFSNRILAGKSINIFEDGEESRDFVFIDDIVDATLMALEKKEADQNIYNVGTGYSTSVLKVTNELMKCYDKIVSYEITGNYRIGDIRHNFADISKIQSELNFLPKVKFEDGILKFAKWVEQQYIREDKYEESLSEMKKKGLLK